MNSPYSALTEEDLSAIDAYMRAFGHPKYIGNGEYLKYWNENKENLFHMFGDKLRITIPVSKQSLDEMVEHETDITTPIEFEFDMLYREAKHALNTWLTYNVVEPGPDVWCNGGVTWLLEEVFNKKNFISGMTEDVSEWNHTYYSLQKSPVNGKVFTLKGTWKIYKLLQRLLKLYPTSNSGTETLHRDNAAEAVENLRIAQSKLKQAKNIDTKIVLSIHPADFLTMSDNPYNWSSCMSIAGDGEYRAGAIEMMNSPVVAIAFIEGDKPYRPLEDSDYCFTSKIWRQLVIIDKDAIITMKSYPHQMPAVSKAVVKNLYDLSGWSFKYPTVERYQDMGSPSILEYLFSYKKDERVKYPGILVNFIAYYNDFASNSDYKGNFFYWVHNTTSKRIDAYGPVPDCVSGEILNCEEAILDEGSYFDNQYDAALEEYEYNREWNDYWEEGDDEYIPAEDAVSYDDVVSDYSLDYIIDRYDYHADLTIESWCNN